jgi:hypothetical protein
MVLAELDDHLETVLSFLGNAITVVVGVATIAGLAYSAAFLYRKGMDLVLIGCILGSLAMLGAAAFLVTSIL